MQGRGVLMSAESYRIAVGADHGGVELKNAIVEALKGTAHEVIDYGTQGTDSVDYPDFANEVGRAVHEERSDRGDDTERSGGDGRANTGGSGGGRSRTTRSGGDRRGQGGQDRSGGERSGYGSGGEQKGER